MSSMNFEEITNFESMERYINACKEKIFNSLSDLELQGKVNQKLSQYNISSNGVVNCFESGILQELSRNFTENQLFFIKKSSAYRYYSVEMLIQKFLKMIDGIYSPHQNVQVGMINPEGDVWVKKYKADSVVPKAWNEDWKKLEDQFSDEEMSILFEDKDILIFTLKLKCEQIVYNIGTKKMSYYENGYWIDPNRPFDILPFSSPYEYHYSILEYAFLYEVLGPEMMTKLNSQYKIISLEMKKQIEALALLQREKLVRQTLWYRISKFIESMGEVECNLNLQKKIPKN